MKKLAAFLALALTGLPLHARAQAHLNTANPHGVPGEGVVPAVVPYCVPSGGGLAAPCSASNPLYVTGGTGGGGSSGPVSNAGASNTQAVPVQNADGSQVATSANQAAGNSALATIATNSGTQATAANQTNGTQKTQITAQAQVGATGAQSQFTASATAGTFTTAIAASSSRKGCFIRYKSTGAGVLSLFVGSGTATVAASIDLLPGQNFDCGQFVVEQGQIQLSSTIASDPNIVVIVQ